MIKIQKDYWTGSKSLENEVPWVVPGAVYLLDKLCKPNYTVLDIGSGGSTLFYARRCKEVIAVETNPEWYKRVKKVLEDREFDNVQYLLVEDQKGIEESIRALGEFDIVSVDSVHGYSRSRFLDIVAPNCQSVLVLDNFAAPELFDTHHKQSAVENMQLLPGYGWEWQEFTDHRWCGRGTRVLYR